MGPSYRNPTVEWVVKKVGKNKWSTIFCRATGTNENGEYIKLYGPWEKYYDTKPVTLEAMIDLSHKLRPLPQKVFDELFLQAL